MLKNTKKIIRDIKSIKIQGARNIANESLRAFVYEVKKNNKTVDYLRKIAQELADARPTEPMTRNFMKIMIKIVEKTLDKKEIEKKALQLTEKMRSDAEKIAEYGAKLIPENSIILTHCHSSTVTKVLIKAKKMKKKFKVIAFETRPRYQGRKTAMELINAGIDVTLAVDGAIQMFMKKADMCLVGADAITSRGDLINKVGTSTLAQIAHLHDVSFYVVAETTKFSEKTLFGELEKIEERDKKEVWDNAPKKLKIRNPAFDVTSAEYINGYITEEGIVPAHSIVELGKKFGTNI